MTLTSYAISSASWCARPASSASRRPSPARTRPTTWAASRASAKGGLVLILDNLEEALRARARAGPGRRRRGGRRAGAAGRRGGAAHAARAVDRRRRVRAPRRDHQRARRAVGEARHAGGDDAGAARRGDGRRHPREAAPCSRGRRSRAASRPRSRPISCKGGPCRPFDLQLAARAIVDLRLASLRRYRRSGGPAVLPALWLRTSAARPAARSRGARCSPPASPTASAKPTWACRPGAGATAAPRRWRRCRRAGCWSAHTRGRKEVFTLAHPALRAIDPGLRDRRSRPRRGCARRALTPPDRDRRAPARAGARSPSTATCAAR